MDSSKVHAILKEIFRIFTPSDLLKVQDMDTEDNEKEVALSLEVDSGVVAKVRSGETTNIALHITEDNQDLILHSIDGNLVLVTDELPGTFHGCYLYNNGVFPYAIKDTLNFLLLRDGEDDCLTRIIGVNTEPGIRFNYQDQRAGEPIKEDPDGDSCVWVVSYEVVPVPNNPKKFLLRWNPSISSFKEKDYEDCVANMENGMFRLNWSIYDWEEAHRGDMFYMMRVGDDKAGIVFSGQLVTDPYSDGDWAGSDRHRMYVDLVCTNPVEPGAKPHISLKELQKSIPEFNWSKGHSGVLLPKEIAEKLIDFWD